MRRASNLFKRPSGHREMLPKVLIACEGRSTEPGYFNAFKADVKLPTAHVYVLRHQGNDPLRVVKGAVDGRDEHRSEPGGWRKMDVAWAVLDGDEHIANNAEVWKDALRLAAKEKIELAISNPSFELWYLLHFESQAGHLTAAQAKRKLGKHVEDYEKSLALYPRIKHLTAEAIQRADHLEHCRCQNGYDEYANPTTGVRLLMRRLLNLQEQAARPSPPNSR
ncbi:MAG: RloB family protein [Actinomycetota bacterium]